MLYDVGKINTFYNHSHGQIVAKLLREDLSNIWEPSKTTSNLAVGFPFYFFPEDIICPVLMPVEIGGIAWAHNQEIYTAIIDSNSWPLESDSIDCIFISHALEFITDHHSFLMEAGRVLKSAGKLILMVPQRRGLWLRTETTPFGHGTPFSKGQIFRLLKNTGLNPEKCTSSLFLPPFAYKLPEALSNQIEIVGEHLLQLLGGVLIVEATKMVYAEPKKNRAKTKARLFAPVKSQSAYSSSE